MKPQSRKELLPDVALRSMALNTFALCWANRDIAHVVVWSCSEGRAVANFAGPNQTVAGALASQVPGSPIVVAPMSALPEVIDEATNTVATLTDVAIIAGLRSGVPPVDMPERTALDGLIAAITETVLPAESDPALFPVGAVQVLERTFANLAHALAVTAAHKHARGGARWN